MASTDTGKRMGVLAGLLPHRIPSSRSRRERLLAERRKYVQRRQPGITPRAAAVIGVAACALAWSAAADADVDLGVELTAGYTNNLLRQSDGEDDVPVSFGFTGNWVETTRHFSANVEGRVDGIKYFNDTWDDEVLGQLDGSLTWWAVPERFAWVVENVYGQVATNPFESISPANRENTNFFSTGPDWYMPFGERMRAYLGGRYGSVRYETSDTDSERLVGIAGIDRAVSSKSRLGIQMSSESVDFDSTLQSDFDRQEAYVRYEFSRDQQTGGLPAGITVNAGYTWLDGDAGDDSAPLIEVLYSKDLSSSVRVGLELASRFSDAGLEFAAGGLPGSGPGIDPGVIPQAGVYEERSGLATIDFQRQRTNLGFAIRLADEAYETDTLDRRSYDLQLTAERRMTRRLTGSARVLWSQDEYESGGLNREDTDTEYRLEFRRELGQRSSIAVIGLYASRSSDDPLIEFDETRGYLVFDYSLL
jgi:hypothetical protein